MAEMQDRQILEREDNTQAIHMPLPPKIPEDDNLILTDPNFAKKFGNSQAPKIIHRFPNPSTLAYFSSICDAEISYDLDPNYASGWELLTASKGKVDAYKFMGWEFSKDAYFGAAFWHPEAHHLVISHRGTNMRRLGDLYTDVSGIVQNDYVPQMFSAATFTAKIVQALKDRKIQFQIFFTGHSLGGWLAQVTTFTSKYLYLEQGSMLGKDVKTRYFVGANDNSNSVHAHTVVFDSPGCEEMLLKMDKDFDVRYYGKSVDLNDLDITTYLSAPNQVNTRNSHIGTLYRVYFTIQPVDLTTIGVSWLNIFKKIFELKNKWNYLKSAHEMKDILQTMGYSESMDNSREVIDWPRSDGLSGGEEYDKFLKWAETLNKFPPEDGNYKTFLGHNKIRYQVRMEPPNPRLFKWNVFTYDEQNILRKYLILRTYQKSTELPSLSEIGELTELLSDFQVVGKQIICSSTDFMQRLMANISGRLKGFQIY